MNQEIHSIVEDMKKYSAKAPLGSSDIQNYLSIQNARLLVLLAEEAEAQSKKVIGLTWATVGLTVALFFLGIIQIMKS